MKNYKTMFCQNIEWMLRAELLEKVSEKAETDAKAKRSWTLARSGVYLNAV